MSGIAVLHLDESCLGNGREGENPGGGGGLIEARSGSRRIQRRDFYISAPATTNNRMALAGAIAALQLLARKGARLQVLIVSDSQYLVKGMREWVPGWVGAGLEAEGRPDREPRALEGPARELAAARRAVDLGPRAQGSREERVRQRPRGAGGARSSARRTASWSRDSTSGWRPSGRRDST